MKLAVVPLLMSLVGASLITSLSFSAPFVTLDQAGHRSIPHFTFGGDTSVYKNFVRLTPDRPSHRGWVRSDLPIGRSVASIVAEFRLSGRGQDLFGDGAALWLTKDALTGHGPIHGVVTDFVGLGLVIDTFRNTDNTRRHFDIAVLWNDGTRTEDRIFASRVGCDIPNLRYYERHVDFSTFNTSRVSLTFDADTTVTINVDPHGSGKWLQCGVLRDHQISAELFQTLHIAVHGETGALSDNHDVVSVHTYDTVGEGEAVHSGPSRPPAEQDNIEELEHHVEGMVERLRSVYNSLKAAEALDESRIQALEFKIASNTADALTKRINEIEGTIMTFQRTNLKQRIATLAQKIDASIDDVLTKRIGELEQRVNELANTRLRNVEVRLHAAAGASMASSSAGSWKIPVGVFALIAVGFYLWTFRWTRKVRFD